MQIRSCALVPLVVACLGVGWFGCAQADTPSPGADSSAQRLGPVPVHVARQVASRDGRHVAIVASRGSKWIVVVDGVEGPPYDALCKGGPVFSRDGKRVAYLAYRQSAARLVVDGAESPVSGGVREWSLLFSPDGQRLMYVAGCGSNQLDCSMVVDGVVGPTHTWVGAPRFSADGKRLAYTADYGSPAGPLPNQQAVRKYRVVVDGVAGPEFLLTGDLDAVFSPDGKRVAYAACTELHLYPYRMTWMERWRVVVDGAMEPEYAAIGRRSPVFSPDGKRVAYAACVKPAHYKWSTETWVAVVDGVAGPEYEIVDSPTFSADGRHVVYVAVKSEGKAKKRVVVVDGVAGTEYDGIESWPVFSPDGRHVTYVAMQGDKKNARYRVVADGVAGPEYDGIGDLAFSPDSQRMAYWARVGQKGFVVLDGVPGRECDDAGYPRFSSDGRHVAYVAQAGKKQFVVCDGRASAEYDQVIRGGPAFRSDGSLEYLAIKEGLLYRVRSPESGSQ